jgi:hypothetical protein
MIDNNQTTKAKPKPKKPKPKSKPNKFVDSGVDFISLTDADGKPIPIS